MAWGRDSEAMHAVPFDAFLDTLKATLIETRQRVGDRQEAVLAAEIRAANEKEGVETMIVRLPSTGGTTGEEVDLSIPKRCLAAAPFLQLSELSVEFNVKVTVREEENPVVVELLGRRQARQGDRGRLLIHLSGDDAVTGSVMINEQLLKVF